MRLLFLSSGRHVPSARFRLLPYLPCFRAEGHHCVAAHSFPQKYDYFPWMGFRPSQLLKRSVRWWHWLRARLNRFDAVIIDREIFDDATTDMEERFRGACGRLIVDVDDAIFLRYPAKFNFLMSLADTVICGNRFLVDRVQPLNSRHCLVPTSVDMDRYTERRPATSSDGPLVIGWTGTTGNLPYLSVAAPALRLLAQDTDYRLRLIVPDLNALSRIDLSGVRVEHLKWQPDQEIEQLQQFDIGLMPLFMDQEWAVYKCGFKLIQYLAVGIPGIASPVGVNADILDDNRNGFAAVTTDEWIAALRTLAGSHELRQQMGHRGRMTVMQRYSVQASYPLLRDAVRKTIERE